MNRNMKEKSGPRNTLNKTPSVKESRPSDTLRNSPDTSPSVDPSNIDQLVSNEVVSDTESNRPTQRKGRGRTRLKEIPLGRSNGKKISIQFDRYWRPIGCNKTKYISFLGVLSRSKPKISFTEWKYVPKSIKNKMWDTIEVYLYFHSFYN